jgi:predicted secreted Zn-dependent protease
MDNLPYFYMTVTDVFCREGAAFPSLTVTFTLASRATRLLGGGKKSFTTFILPISPKVQRTFFFLSIPNRAPTA